MMVERIFNVPKKVVRFDATSLTTFVIKSYDSICCLQRLVFFIRVMVVLDSVLGEGGCVNYHLSCGSLINVYICRCFEVVFVCFKLNLE